MSSNSICGLVNLTILGLIWIVLVALPWLIWQASWWVLALWSMPALVASGYIEERLISAWVNQAVERWLNVRK